MKLGFKEISLIFLLLPLIACNGSSSQQGHALGGGSGGGGGAASDGGASEGQQQANPLVENRGVPAVRARVAEARVYVPFSHQVEDPCRFRDWDGLPTPRVQRAFGDDTASYEAFQQTYRNDSVTALKQWLLSTPTFEGVASIEDFELIQIDERGVGHAGVYEISFSQDPGRRFILKVSTHTGEAEHGWKLQNSLVGHPECFLQPQAGLSRVATQEEVALFPKIPRMLEAASFPLGHPQEYERYGGASRTHRYLILMQKAAGQALACFDHNQQETLAIYRTVGKSLGYFHSFMPVDPRGRLGHERTLIHGDLHANTIFFDPATSSVSWIDNDRLSRGWNIEEDIKQLVYRDLYQSINTGHSLLLPYLAELQRQEAERRNLRLVYSERPVGRGELHFQDAMGDALENPDVRRDIPNSEAFQEVTRRYGRFKAVVQGCMEAFPEERRNEVRAYFGGMG